MEKVKHRCENLTIFELPSEAIFQVMKGIYSDLRFYFVNNSKYESFHDILFSILTVNEPFKENHLRTNYANFITKEFRIVVMKRAFT